MIATKVPKAPVFNLPHECNVARMLRSDLAAARKAVRALHDLPRVPYHVIRRANAYRRQEAEQLWTWLCENVPYTQA